LGLQFIAAQFAVPAFYADQSIGTLTSSRWYLLRYTNLTCAVAASRRQTNPLTFFSKAPLVSYSDSSALPLALQNKIHKIALLTPLKDDQ